MIINLSPVRSDEPAPEVIYSKDALTINGQLFDFGPLPDGATLPAIAVSSPWFVDQVHRIDGEIQLTLVLPHGINPSESVAFPEAIRVTKAGAVKLPFDEPIEPEDPYVAPIDSENEKND